ncbi:MAG: tetratricopeptide repeat protein [Bacteroidota bacterium]|nr:tetratricopeptide repeat protein [Bacteroidota bacterium]
MKTYSLLTWLLYFGLIVNVWSQENQKKIDSILQIISQTKIDTVAARNYLELSDLTMYNDPNKTLEYLEKAQELYHKNNNGKDVAKLYAQKANYYYRLGKIDSARHYLNNSVDQSLEIGDTLRASVIRHNIGILDHYQGNTESANAIMNQNIPVFKKFDDSLHLGNAYLLKGKIGMTNGFFNIALLETQKALKIHEALHDDFRMAEDLFQIGTIYQTTEDHEKAISIFEESIAHYQKVEKDQSHAQVLNYLADSKIKLNQLESAKQDLDLALELSQKLEYTSNIARTYFNKGLLEYTREAYPDASTDFESSLNIWEEMGSPYNEATSLLYLGRTKQKLGELQQALTYIDRSLKIGKELQDPEILAKVYLAKAEVLEGLKDYDAALANFKLNKSISDSIFTLQRTKATEELKTIYETEKKEQQIVLLEQEAKVSNLQKLLLGVGLGLSLLVLGFGFYGIRQKLKRNKLEKEKVDAELAFKKKELTTHALHLAKKNEVLEDLKQKAEVLKQGDGSKNGYQQLIRTIDFDLQDDNNWENFSRYFEEVHKDFNSNVKAKFPDITANELRLLALLKMNLSSKEIANILNISQEGIKKARYRLRKKLNIPTEDSLQDLVLSL